MRQRFTHIAFAAGLLSSGAALAHGCAAANGDSIPGFGGSGPATLGSGGGIGAGIGGTFKLPDAGTSGTGDVSNPCGSECGSEELCDEAHLGLDDNCNGEVDEGCTCTSGQAHFCFKGDPSFRGVSGCYDGIEKCSELGTWGPCIGGVHAIPPDSCGDGAQPGCHAIQAAPFGDVSLKTGTGSFGDNADPGSEHWTVECPTGVDPCPAVALPDAFKPLQSGEYTVRYSKTVDGEPDTCTYPLFVGARGLRVELSWEHPDPPGDLGGVDVDLHLHKPGNHTHWGTDGFEDDCGYMNCTISAIVAGRDPFPNIQRPRWFGGPSASPPAAVNWYEDPIEANNTCYFAPRGAGAKWKEHGKGCYNPRLDVDNIRCDTGVSNPRNDSFCTPENINVDFPPKDKWMRIGVYYYSSAGKGYDVHPNVKVFCNGALSAELGNVGYYSPEAPVTFPPEEGARRFWEVADVIFLDSECATTSQCIVRPLYADEETKTPYFVTKAVANTEFGPPYPAAP